MKYNAFPTACEVFTNGEVEDYTVNIVTGTTAKPETDNETIDESIVESNNETIDESNNETVDASVTVNKEDSGISFKLYPNPVKDETLYFSGMENSSSYRIFNLMGQQIANGNTYNNSVNVGALATGIYIIQVSDGKSIGTKRFIKE
jgi:hypothetical protein